MIPRTAAAGHVAPCGGENTIDSAQQRDYIDAMADNINSTFEHELRRLEKRVDALVSVCDQLQDENRSLKQRQDVLTSERATLLQKNEQVRARVEAMIGRLKAMEQGS
jgi:cell division protein ZapB